MTLRSFTGAAFTFLVNELRAQALTMEAAIEAVHEVFKPEPTGAEKRAAEAAAEAERNRRNEQVTASLMMGALPPPKRQATA